MTEPDRIPSRAPAELMELAKWIDDQLGATLISRQVIAEQAADRIRDLAEWLRGAAEPGHVPQAGEPRPGEPRLAGKDLRVRPEDERAPLVAALLGELPRTAEEWEKAVAASLAEYDDSTCELVTSWLRQARADGAAGTEVVHRRILDEAIARYGESVVRRIEGRDDEAGT